MITPNEVVGLSEVEQGQSQAVEVAIDAAITAMNAVDPMQKQFDIDAASLGEVTVKVREHTFARYRKAKWAVAALDGKYTFMAPERKKGGRKPGSKNKPKTIVLATTPVEVVEATLPVALPA